MNTSTGLFLPSLRIEGVRAIRSLEAHGLGRVNLFVGANNAGKTSLLEALRLYAARGIPQAFRDILESRGLNLLDSTPANSLEDWGLLMEATESVFHGIFNQSPLKKMRIGAAGRESSELVIELDSGENGGQAPGAGFSEPAYVPAFGLRVRYANEPVAEFPATRFVGPVHPSIKNQISFATYVAPCGIADERRASLWDRVTLTEGADQVLAALRIIVPDLEGISFVGGGRGRYPVARVRNASRPVPLQTMGDGVNRLLGIALAMVNAERGFLLIDEFENGLYYGVQGEVWKAVFALAEQLEVQVFATTHSWDCIVGFQEAAKESPVDGMLYRLTREADDHVRTTAYKDSDVAIAAEQLIEVR